jgi:hypothetical protein
VYCNNAIVFKNGGNTGYSVLQEPVLLSFVAVAAVSKPKLVENSGKIQINPQDRAKTEEKIRAIVSSI